MFRNNAFLLDLIIDYAGVQKFVLSSVFKDNIRFLKVVLNIWPEGYITKYTHIIQEFEFKIMLFVIVSLFPTLLPCMC